MNYINLYNRENETNNTLPKTRYNPYGRGGHTTHGLSNKDTTMEGITQENDVPNILPYS